MRGTNFEFRHRFGFIVAIFFLAFGSFYIEPVNAVAWLEGILGRRGTPFAFGFCCQTAAAHAIFALGALLVGAAAWVRTWGTAYLNNDVVRDNVVRADFVVADGPYRYVRNPLYFGSMLMAVGLAPMAPPIGSVFLIAGIGLLFLRLIGREELFLAEKQGGAYRAYCAKVPRLWPALRPRLPSGGTRPQWGQAWAAEMWMWILFAGSIIFAVTLKPRLFEYIVWGGFLLYLPIRRLMKRQARRRPF